MAEQTHSIESLFFSLSLFCTLFLSVSFFLVFLQPTHPLSHLILDRFSCAVPVDLGSFRMLGEKLGSELAIKFLHYKISTSWRCKDGGEEQRGDTCFPRELEAKQGLMGRSWLKLLLLLYSHTWLVKTLQSSQRGADLKTCCRFIDTSPGARLQNFWEFFKWQLTGINRKLKYSWRKMYGRLILAKTSRIHWNIYAM